MASQNVYSQTPSQSQTHTTSQTPPSNTTPLPDTSAARARARYAADLVATKAKWDGRTSEIFISLCVTETTNGNRPGPHFNKLGWKNLVTRFNQATGKSYTRKMLKNKWDVMRKDWGIWTKLIRNETGLGWDPVLGTVVASPEWWTRKLQVTPEASKFRSKGPLMIHEQEILFADCVASGAASWAPNSGIMPQHMADEMENEGDPDPLDLVDEEVEYGHDANGSHMDDEDGTFETATQTQTAPLSNEEILRRSRPFPRRARISKVKKTTTAQIVARCLQSMANNFDKLSPQPCSCTTKADDNTMDTCLTILDGLEGIEEGDEVWMYATRLFLKAIVRELFVKLKTDRMRVLWLKNQMLRDQRKGGLGSSPTVSTSSMDPSCHNQNY